MEQEGESGLAPLGGAGMRPQEGRKEASVLVAIIGSFTLYLLSRLIYTSSEMDPALVKPRLKGL